MGKTNARAGGGRCERGLGLPLRPILANARVPFPRPYYGGLQPIFSVYAAALIAGTDWPGHLTDAYEDATHAWFELGAAALADAGVSAFCVDVWLLVVMPSLFSVNAEAKLTVQVIGPKSLVSTAYALAVRPAVDDACAYSWG